MGVMKCDLLFREIVRSFIKSTCKNSSARAGGNISMMASAYFFFSGYAPGGRQQWATRRGSKTGAQYAIEIGFH
jgi:hypothetical protein